MKNSLRLMAAMTVAIGFGLSVKAQPAWPRQLPSPTADIWLYQPQIDSFSGNQFTAHAAVSVSPLPAGGTPKFGVVFFSAMLATDRGSDLATAQSITVTGSRFPGSAPGTADAVTASLTQAAADGGMTFSQSELLAQLALTQQETAAANNLNNTPPQILFATQPSVLVSIAGAPQLVAAPDSSLMTVVNSPFFIALDPATRTYYLRGGGQWLSTSDILQGPWTPTTSIPEAVTALAAKQPSGSADSSPVTPASQSPQVIVATQPTELIQTTGPAEYAPIDNTNLLYVTNTTSTVLMDIDTQSLYVLLSGRWFTAPAQNGPWSYVAPAQLPADFARIPAGLPISNALASVPGTHAARDAAMDAQIPQTAAIQRQAPAPNVTYDGDPKFEPVAKGSSVTYAVNTRQSVVYSGNTYFLCSDGVWYQATSPTGPWIVAATVPPVIYTIPPTCPVYPITYVRIYGATPDVVYCGYLPGYTGSFIAGGALVYGTGWPYDPWFGSVFIPRPVTWGFGASFAFGAGWGFSVGAGWGVTSFGCGWNSGWWGTGNYQWNNWNFNRSWNQQVNITRNVTNNVTNNYYTRNITNLYRNNPDRLTPAERQRLDANQRTLADQENRLRTQQQRDDARDTAAAARNNTIDQRQIDRDQAQRAADRARLEEPAPRRNDVYADRDGNVYRHDGSEWQQRDGDAWRRADGDAYRAQRASLNRQFAARSRSYGGGGGRRR